VINIVIAEHAIVVELFGNTSLPFTFWSNISYPSTDWNATSWSKIVAPVRSG